MTFIAAMDHSGGSTGGVLERYGQEYTEEDKMIKVHEMRLRMVNSPNFNSNNIWAAILYQDTVERGMVPILKEKGIESYLKIDSGCEDTGYLKYFGCDEMIKYAIANGCTGTKMRSIVKTHDILNPILTQQFALAKSISDAGLMPIVEPEVPIDFGDKGGLEAELKNALSEHLAVYDGKCILKLTLPDNPNLYNEIAQLDNVHKVVGLSGGYSTDEACNRLSQNNNMTASFSRALSEGLYVHQTDQEFEDAINKNIKMIVEASNR